MSSWLVPRYHFWRSALKGWWLIVTGAFSIWTLLGKLRVELVPAADQDKWKLPFLLPHVPWYWWLTGVSILTLAAVLEGSYRAYRKSIDGVTRDKEPGKQESLERPSQLTEANARIRERHSQLEKKHELLLTSPDSLECRDEWLHDVADTQNADISRYVRVQGCSMGEKRLTEPVPSVQFHFSFSNESVFALSIEDEIRGYIAFETQHQPQRLVGPMILITNDFKDVPHREWGTITIELRLSREEAALIMQSNHVHDAVFSFRWLELTLRGGKRFPGVSPQRLILSEVLDLNGKPLPAMQHIVADLREKDRLLKDLRAKNQELMRNQKD